MSHTEKRNPESDQPPGAHPGSASPFQRLVVLDTETGGLDPEIHSLIEVAARVVDLHHDAKRIDISFEPFVSKVSPWHPVSPEAAKVNGYTEKKWADAPSLGLFAERFLGWLDGLTAPRGGELLWTGSNVGFDLGFIKSDLAILEYGVLPGKPKFSRRLLNTESLCFPLLLRGEVDSLGISALRKWAGLPGEQTHTALGDVDDTVAIIDKYIREEVWARGHAEGSP